MQMPNKCKTAQFYCLGLNYLYIILKCCLCKKKYGTQINPVNAPKTHLATETSSMHSSVKTSVNTDVPRLCP